MTTVLANCDVIMDGTFNTAVIQVTNIAPQATRDQMQTLFAFVGRIEDLRLYPSIRDASVSVASRCCFVKFSDPGSISVAQHLTNTVFIDRAIIVTPVLNGDIPDERDGLIMATQFQQQGTAGNGLGRFGSSSGINGNAVSATPVSTQDATLEVMGLPPYPILPAGTPLGKVDEIRRTVTVVGIDSTVSAQSCMELFSEAGEVKYFRYCTRPNDPIKYALIEFTDISSVGPALLINDRVLGMSKIKVTHAIQAISKPQAKSSEAVQREIEEAMSKVKETQSLVSAAVDPLIGILGGIVGSGAGTTSMRSSHTRSRSRSKSRRRSRSRDRSHMSSRRSRSRDRRRGGRSRSRSRDRKRSKSRERRRRSRSRDKKRSKRSRSKSRERRKRSRSRDRKKESEKKDESAVEKNGSSDKNGPATEDEKTAASTVDEVIKKKSRSRSRSRKRSRSREKKKKSRSRSRERRRSRSRDRKPRRSTSRDRRRKRSRSRKRKDRSRSKDRSSTKTSSSTTKVSRDYDMEEAGFENPKEKSAPPDEETTPKKEILETEDMEISNSP